MVPNTHPLSGPRSHETPLGARRARLVRAAQRGDAQAWNELVASCTPMLRREARRFRLAPHDVDDVVQLVWLQAVRRLHTLQDPHALTAWLTTIARRSALRPLQIATSECLTDDTSSLAKAAAPLEDAVISRERAVALREAVERLPPRQRALMSALLADLDGGYHRVANALGMPIGSIGPTRGRSLARLRNDRALLAALTG